MQPVQDLLNRIRWDEVFATAVFEIGYYDRIEDQIIQVKYAELFFPTDDHFAFELLDDEGSVHRIPYHRIRRITRNGHCIWSRSPH